MSQLPPAMHCLDILEYFSSLVPDIYISTHISSLLTDSLKWMKWDDIAVKFEYEASSLGFWDKTEHILCYKKYTWLELEPFLVS